MLFHKPKILTGAFLSLLLSITGSTLAIKPSQAQESMDGSCQVGSDYVEVKGTAHCFTGDIVMIDVEGVGTRTIVMDSKMKAIMGLVPGMRLTAYAKQKSESYYDLQCVRVISKIDPAVVDTDAIRAEIRSKLELAPRKVAQPNLTPRAVPTRRPVSSPRPVTRPRPVRGLW